MQENNKSKIADASRKAKKAGGKILKTVKRKRLKYIPLFPSLITIINGLFGFAAIVMISNYNPSVIKEVSYYHLQLTLPALAGYMVLLAMIADVLDGRVARISNSTSDFGGQLDSLCDVISFGVAPAFIIIKLITPEFDSLEDLPLVIQTLLKRLTWLGAAAYITCAVIRLARFNVENAKSNHLNFSGLPTPASAGVIASLVIFQQEALPEFAANTSVYPVINKSLLWTLPFAGFVLAILMVSRIDYPHILNQYFKGKKPFAYLMMALAAVGMVIWVRQVALVLGFWGFAIGGLIKYTSQKFTTEKTSTAPENETADEFDI